MGSRYGKVKETAEEYDSEGIKEEATPCFLPVSMSRLSKNYEAFRDSKHCLLYGKDFVSSGFFSYLIMALLSYANSSLTAHS